MNPRAIIVFAKAPLPGQVKTRLSTALSPARAAALHARLTVNTLRLADRLRPAHVYLYGHPDVGHPFFPALARRFSLTLRPQRGGDLGERMLRALSEVLCRHHHALLIGCDCPSLTPDTLRQAFAALEKGRDVVLAPAEDGGYVLIGVNRPLSPLFRNIPWGGPTVHQETLSRIRSHHLRHTLLPMQWDLDRPEDLERYHRLSDNRR